MFLNINSEWNMHTSVEQINSLVSEITHTIRSIIADRNSS